MLAEIIRFTSFLLPILFMILFYIKTDKLNFLKKYGILTLFIPIFVSFYSIEALGYPLQLILAYMIFVIFGTTYLNNKGWTYSRALSLSFCLTYFGSFFWEIPTHIYTIIIRGGIDGSFPLLLLYILPMFFVYEKVKTNYSKKSITILITYLLSYSTLILYFLISNNIDIWQTTPFSPVAQSFTQILWMMNRIFVIIPLILLYSKSSLRKKVTEASKKE